MVTRQKNRLIGTVTLFALLVIFLPDLLDGNKVAESEPTIAKIPLRPELEPAKPALTLEASSALATAHQAAQSAAVASDPTVTPVKKVVTTEIVVADKPKMVEVKPKEPPVKVVPPKEKSVVESKLATTSKTVASPVEDKPEYAKIKSVAPLNAPTTATQIATPATATPTKSGAWIIQLGAFKSVESVNQLVGKLRAAGYPASSIPRTPVAGQINRVVVGPDVSKDKLQGMLPALNRISGTSGAVVPYRP